LNFFIHKWIDLQVFKKIIAKVGNKDDILQINLIMLHLHHNKNRKIWFYSLQFGSIDKSENYGSISYGLVQFLQHLF